MKTIRRILITGLLACACLATQASYAPASPDKIQNDQQTTLYFRGKVVDSDNGTPLIFASVAVKETNVATITNIDGEFLIKINESDASRNLEITYLGYRNKVVPLSELRSDDFKNIIELSPAPIPIKEIVVRPLDPEEIVRSAIGKISKNYTDVPNLMTAFYRETIKKNRNYVSIGEAVVEIFKAPYNNDLRFDGARIYKGRKSSDVERMDTLLFKLQGGPVSVLQLDIVKNQEAILTFDAMQYYDYRLSSVIEIDEKPHYVIEFKQKPSVDMPLFMGSFFIEADTYALTEAEFGFNLDDKEAVSSIFIRKTAWSAGYTGSCHISDQIPRTGWQVIFCLFQGRSQVQGQLEKEAVQYILYYHVGNSYYRSHYGRSYKDPERRKDKAIRCVLGGSRGFYRSRILGRL